MSDLVTVILSGNAGEITLDGVDLLGFEEFAAAGPERDFEFGGPMFAPFWVGDRVTVTIPEYEYSSPGRVTIVRSTSVPPGPEYNWSVVVSTRLATSTAVQSDAPRSPGA